MKVIREALTTDGRGTASCPISAFVYSAFSVNLPGPMRIGINCVFHTTTDNVSSIDIFEIEAHQGDVVESSQAWLAVSDAVSEVTGTVGEKWTKTISEPTADGAKTVETRAVMIGYATLRSSQDRRRAVACTVCIVEVSFDADDNTDSGVELVVVADLPAIGEVIAGVVAAIILAFQVGLEKTCHSLSAAAVRCIPRVGAYVESSPNERRYADQCHKVPQKNL